MRNAAPVMDLRVEGQTRALGWPRRAQLSRAPVAIGGCCMQWRWWPQSEVKKAPTTTSQAPTHTVDGSVRASNSPREQTPAHRDRAGLRGGFQPIPAMAARLGVG